MFAHNCFILNQKNHYTNTEFVHMSSGIGQTAKPKEEEPKEEESKEEEEEEESKEEEEEEKEPKEEESKEEEEEEEESKEEEPKKEDPVELEIQLLIALQIYSPKKLAGMQRNFVLFGLMEYLKRHFNRDFSSEEVLQLVDRFYNIEMLEDDEEIDMLNHEEDFSLPQSYFPKVQS